MNTIFRSHALTVRACATLLAAFGAASCRPPESEGAPSATPAVVATTPAATERVLVRTDGLRRGQILAAIDVTTDIESEVRVDVYPKVGPAYVARMLVDEGDRVRSGDPLVYLDDVDFRIALERRKSELRQAEQRYAQSKVALAGAQARERMQKATTERARADYDRAVASRSGNIEVLSVKEINDLTKEFEMRQAEYEVASFSIEQAETDLQLTQLAIDAAKIEVDAAEKDLASTVVRAQTDGVVQQRDVNVGVLVNSATHLFTLIDPARLVANLRVPQEELARVTIGMPVEFNFDALPGQVFTGRVEAINPTVDPSSGLAKVRARLPDNAVDTVRPGMFSRARIVVESHDDAVLISKRAVVYEAGRTWFFTVADGRARRLPFQPGASTPDEMEILSVDGQAPDPSLTIITVGQDRLRDGDEVSVAATP